jgi:hypothetical protein
VTAAIQGEPPSLGGLAQDEAGLVRGLLDKFRREDLAGKPTDCKAASDALNAASGGKGIVQESASGYTPHVPGIEHTMWQLGEQFIDTRPGMWRGIFRINPAARAALNRVIAGLAERLEARAVLTRAEHELYQGRGRAPASTLFDGKPVPGRNAQQR